MNQRNFRKERIGIVVSNKMNKTIIVVNNRKIKHHIYKKFTNKITKYYVHDETNMSNEGDIVRIMETRPLSKNKRWRLVETIVKAK
ncbi:30S ribosomal protein S17 [uncultured Bacteroides sp.]|uniref:30S ribosomal protein S17 n=1 Tax=uncultured Bacteroides sp. TaxID=162156 RepID=UPI002AAC1B47|nr:30S ribosomal protein S17 [uncultured Bacteroides sp.]